MLPSELLITRTRKDRIYPDFLELNAEHVELAQELIEIYRSFSGRKKSELVELLEELEQGLHFKRVRGLRTLLERRCTFASRFAIEPVTARRAVFEAASLVNVTNPKERAAVIAKVAESLEVTATELEQSLWADLDSEVVLEQFEPITAEALIKKYNLSLAQTLLFKATGMTLTVKTKAPELFRAIKYFGLMYLPEDGNRIRIEGASSLLKLNERYGTALAKLLPAIVRSESWILDAEIVVRRANMPRIYHFIMDSRDRPLVMSDEPVADDRENSFDSTIEQKFYNEFVSLPTAKNWEIIREPDVLFTKRGVFIPDFKFRHRELELETYFEIVGFWTETYLKRKLAKIGSLPFTMLVAINKNLACFNVEPFGFGVDKPLILYTKKVPVGDVVRYLTALEHKAVAKQLESLTDQHISLRGDIIPLAELAREYGTSQEAVRECVKDPAYVIFKDTVVRRELLEQLKWNLSAVDKYVEARAIIEKTGLTNADEVLAHLGYKVTWKGLDVNEARIEIR